MAIEIKIIPNSHPQEDFFKTSEYEVLYGGAAGGGKSWSLVVEPIRFLKECSKFTGIIFRRTYPELEGSIIPLTHEYYLNCGATWNEQKKRYLFPSGAVMRLGFMQYKDDWRSYQGHEYAYQAFDELTNFEEDQYKMLSVWNRSKQEGVPPYRRAASNPGGVGHLWVKRRFVDVCKPVKNGPRKMSLLGQMYYQPMMAGKTYYYRDKTSDKVLSRKFIPSRVFDNVDLLRLNPNYLAQLLALPERKRRGLLEGDWNVFEGQFFEEWFEDVHVIEPENYLNWDILRENFRLIGGMDYGNASYVYVLARDANGDILIIDEWWDEKGTRKRKIDSLASFLKERKLERLPIMADTNMWIPDSFDVEYSTVPAQEFLSAGIRLQQVSKTSPDHRRYRIACNDTFRDALHWEEKEGKLVVKPRLKVYRRCNKFIEHFPALSVDDKDVEDIADGQYDHPYDAAKYGFMSLYVPRKRKDSIEDKYPWLKKVKKRSKGTSAMSK